MKRIAIMLIIASVLLTMVNLFAEAQKEYAGCEAHSQCSDPNNSAGAGCRKNNGANGGDCKAYLGEVRCFPVFYYEISSCESFYEFTNYGYYMT